LKNGNNSIHFFFQLTDPDDVDSFITNNVPDPVNQPELHELVTTFMFHQECSERCINCVTGKCSKGYPMQFLENTRMDDGRGWVAIKRPEGGHTFKWKGKEYDIRRVVPYNPFLLKTMGCHLNVLPVCSLFQIAYLFKYVCKGLDQADVEFTVKQSGYVIKVYRTNLIETFDGKKMLFTEPKQTNTV